MTVQHSFFSSLGQLLRRRRLLLLFCGLAVALSLPGHPSGAATPEPELRVMLPTEARVGETIAVDIWVDHAVDLAGFETVLLFDTTAVHFSGVDLLDNDMRRWGRGVVPLAAAELPHGVAFGFGSCPQMDCINRRGVDQPQGARGTLRLARLFLVVDQPGTIELAFGATKFVDPSGQRLLVRTPRLRHALRVGRTQTPRGPRSPGWTLPAGGQRPAPGPFDLTGDSRVTYADGLEVALVWQTTRYNGQPCGQSVDLSRDLTRDGCVDVGDMQVVLRHATSAVPTRTGGNNANNAPQGETLTFATGLASSLNLTVNSVGDEWDKRVGDGICATTAGDCSLRAALNEAVGHAGAETILFNIPGAGPHTIQLSRKLPVISDESGGITIDGYSQPGAVANSDPYASNALIKIQIMGTGENNFDGIVVTSPNNVIRGLSLSHFNRAVWIYGAHATNNQLSGSFIGTDAAGVYGAPGLALPGHGVNIEQGAKNNRIGGTTPADRNVISGNPRHGVGIWHTGTTGNVVINAIVGLSPLGDRRVANRKHGMDINYGASANVFGGTGPNERNVVSGNDDSGIEVSHNVATSANRVVGNLIGTDVTGRRATSYSYNFNHGIYMEDAVTQNIISDNVVGNNLQGGIAVLNVTTTRNQIFNNRVGISLDGTPIPNKRYGIIVSGIETQIGPNNIVAYNEFAGIRIDELDADRNLITQNSIFANGALGIDLAPISAVNANDLGDLDQGANEQLNAPELVLASPEMVQGRACVTCTVELFIADRAPGNYGQGKTFVISTTVESDGNFTATLSGLQVGVPLTAVAIDSQGNSSEFAQNVAVVIPNGSPSVSANGPYRVGEEGAVSVQASGSDPENGPVSYAWDLDGDGTFETAGTTATFSAVGLDGPTSRTVAVRITDNQGAVATDSTEIQVLNEAPTGVVGQNGPVSEGGTVVVSVSNASDPSEADRTAGLRYAFACDGGTLAGVSYATASPSPSRSCAYGDGPASIQVRGAILDKDGGVRESTTTVVVNNVAPQVVITGAPASSIEGTAISLGSSVSDPSPTDTSAGFSRSWNVTKDGVPFAAGSDSSFILTPGDNGSYRVTLTVSDKDGAATSTAVTILVANANPTARLTPSAPTIGEGQVVTFTLDNEVERGTDDQAAGLRYAFACNGESLASVSYATASAIPSQGCLFDDNPGGTVRSRVLDKDGGFSEYTSTVVVTNMPPTALFDAPLAVVEGEAVPLAVLKPGDPSAADLAAGLSYAFDCGSGYTSFSTTTRITCAPSPNPTHAIGLRVRDKDGGLTEYRAVVVVSRHLLLNPGFENDINNDGRVDEWTYSRQLTRSTSVVHGGSYALRHSATDNSGYITSQTFTNIVPNARYRFGLWVNIPATSDSFSFALQVRWRDLNTNTISVYTIKNYTAATNGWEFVSADLVSRPGTASVKVEMAVSSLNATVYTDDIFFVAGNQLENPSFELDANADERPDVWWVASRATRSPSVVHSGNYAMRHFGTDDASYYVGQLYRAVTPGKRYHLGGWVYIPPTTDSFSLRIQMRWRDVGQASLSVVTIKNFTQSTPGWVYASAEIVAPAGSTNANVELYVTSLKTTLYTDDFILSMLP